MIQALILDQINLFQAGRPSTSLTIGHLTSFAETLDEQYIIQPG
jgi:hypothetical protein